MKQTQLTSLKQQAVIGKDQEDPQMSTGHPDNNDQLETIKEGRHAAHRSQVRNISAQSIGT